MRKQYDDFTQLKPKEMSKAISDMTYKYINPDTQEPTKVPSSHYEKILGQITEKYIADVTSRQILVLIYNQLCKVKEENEKYFNQALVCMDLGINPKDLRINEQIAIECTNNFIEDKKNFEKKKFHFLSDDIVNAFEESKNDPNLQSEFVKASNYLEDREDNMLKRKSDFDREDR